MAQPPFRDIPRRGALRTGRKTMSLLLTAALIGELGEPGSPIRIVVESERTLVAASNGVITEIIDGDIKRSASVANALSGFAAHPATNFLAVNAREQQILAVSAELKTSASLSLPGLEQIAVDPASGYFVATCKWRKSVAVVSAAPLKIMHQIELSFEPLMAVFIGESRFLVTDAFRGEAAVVNVDGTHKLLKPLWGHNIRGLLVVGDEIFVSHQKVSEIARSEFSDVHWGMLMQNVLSRVPLKNIAAGEFAGKTVTVGEVGNGSADPSAIAKLPDGRFAVALSGANQVVISSLPDKSGRFWFDESPRYPTGQRPVHLAVASDNRTLMVANSMDHKVTIVRFPSLDQYPRNSDGRMHDRLIPETSALAVVEEPSELTAVERGRRAFFSGKLSHDSWFSCNSCHTDGHTIGFRADTLGDGNFGAAKLIPSLLGVTETAPWGWSGNFESLTDQIRKSVETTMHGTPDEETSNDILAYLKTLKPRPVVERRSPSGQPMSDPLVIKGRELFTSRGCIECHKESTYTSDRVVNVGLTDAVGQAKFNPPSLRSISHRRVFFHDASAKSLGSALELHINALKKKATASERNALREFLLSL